MSHCDVCNVDIPSGEEAVELHESGKKHMKLRAQREVVQALQDSSVFVKWKSKLLLAEESLSTFFQQFGHIDRILFRSDRMFAIVEFSDSNTAEKILSVGTAVVDGITLTFEKRKIEFTPQEAIKPHLNLLELHAAMENVSTFSEQAAALIKCMVLQEKEIQRRMHFIQLLQEGLADYLINPTVTLFGSTITGVGTVDSDMDATVFVNNPKEIVPELLRDKYTLLTCDPSLFKGRKISNQELIRLTCADRVRLISKIINEVRKTAGWIGHQRPVLDARCPVVRFNIFKSCMIDLSVANMLGVKKSLYLKTLLEQERSGNLQKILIAFRFWGFSNGLFEPPSNQHVGHFNAYILNLFVIYYLMENKIIPPFEFTKNEEIFGSWRVDFSIPVYDLGALDLAAFFKQFFIHMVETHLSDIVFGPYSMTKDVFQSALISDERLKPFKFSSLNIQDPIERSHNVAQNITEKSLALMKKQMMFSLSAMKKVKIVLLTHIVGVSSRPTSPTLKPLPMLDYYFQFPECDKMTLLGLKKVITAIFEEILFWDIMNLNEPNFKRMKLEEAPIQDKDANIWQSGCYSIKFPLWVGRRSIKRRLLQLNNNWSGLELEKKVSEELLKSFTKNDSMAYANIVIYRQDANTFFLGLKHLEGSQLEMSNAWHFATMMISNYWSEIILLL